MCLYCDIDKSSGKLTAIYLHQNACLYFKRSNRMLCTIKQKIGKCTKKENKLFKLPYYKQTLKIFETPLLTCLGSFGRKRGSGSPFKP